MADVFSAIAQDHRAAALAAISSVAPGVGHRNQFDDDPRGVGRLDAPDRRWLQRLPPGRELDDADPRVMLASMSLTADQARRLLMNNYDPGTNGVVSTTGDPGFAATLMLTRAVIDTPK
jgi:hypothetical protein